MTLATKLKQIQRQTEEIDSMARVMLTRLERAEDMVRKLRQDKGKFPHACKVDSSFFGTTVEMGADPVKMKTTFFWHRGRPALKVSADRKKIFEAYLEDGALVEIKRL